MVLVGAISYLEIFSRRSLGRMRMGSRYQVRPGGIGLGDQFVTCSFETNYLHGTVFDALLSTDHLKVFIFGVSFVSFSSVSFRLCY